MELTTKDQFVIFMSACCIFASLALAMNGAIVGWFFMWINLKIFDMYCMWRKDNQ